MTNPPPITAAKTAPNPVLRTFLARLLMLVVIVISVWLVWWSVNHQLLPVLRQGQQKAAEVSSLASEVQQLEQQWSPLEAERMEGNFQEAKDSLFTGPPARHAQEEELKQKALAYNFDAQVQPGETQPHPFKKYKIALTLTTIDLKPSAAGLSTNSPYQRLLNFTRIIQEPKSRMDFVELSVTGNSNSVWQAKAVLQLWSKGDKLQ